MQNPVYMSEEVRHYKSKTIWNDVKRNKRGISSNISGNKRFFRELLGHINKIENKKCHDQAYYKIDKITVNRKMAKYLFNSNEYQGLVGYIKEYPIMIDEFDNDNKIHIKCAMEEGSLMEKVFVFDLDSRKDFSGNYLKRT